MTQEIPENAASAALKKAKELLARGDVCAALQELKLQKPRAVSDYNLALKLSKAAAKIIGADAQNSLGLKKAKVALLSSSTTDFLEPILRYFFAECDINAEVRSGGFGNWKQDILNPGSWLAEFDPDAVVIATNYRDAPLKALSENPEAEALKIADDFESLWRSLKLRAPKAVILQHDFDLPEFDSASLLSDRFGGRRDILNRASLEMEKRSKGAGAEIVKISRLQARFGAEKWEDLRMYFHAKQHPQMNALPLVAAEYARVLRAKLLPPKKVCVLDLDNTLWGGIIGEDGLGGIELGAPSARGEAFAAFQKYLKELKERGIVLAVCSKNNLEDAKLPFERHGSSVLRLDDFAAFKANWEPKSANISSVARELNLGLDSFVFIDDDPAEIAEVSAALPQVKCLLPPEDPADFVPFLDGQNLFDALAITQDDLSRAESYRQNAVREEAKSGFSNLDDFLKSLEMRCAARDINSDSLARVVQLLGKTNQFNLTTRRETEAQVRETISDPKNYARCFALSDKFGDSGIAAVALASPKDGGKTLEIETFAMSCRVIGRGLEDFILSDIFAFAKKSGMERVRGIYIPTKKNAQTKGLYGKFGFKKISESEEKTVWEIPAKDFAEPKFFISKL